MNVPKNDSSKAATTGAEQDAKVSDKTTEKETPSVQPLESESTLTKEPVALEITSIEASPTISGERTKSEASRKDTRVASHPVLAEAASTATAVPVSAASLTSTAGLAPASSSSGSRHIRTRSREGKSLIRPSISMNSLESHDPLNRSVRSFNTLSSNNSATRRKSVKSSIIVRTKSSIATPDDKSIKDHSTITSSVNTRNGSDKKSNVNQKLVKTKKSTSVVPNYALNKNIKLSKMKKPSQCQLFCTFYAEFDDIVGPQVCFQSPRQFMDHDIAISTEEIEELLAKSFHQHNLDVNVENSNHPPAPTKNYKLDADGAKGVIEQDDNQKEESGMSHSPSPQQQQGLRSSDDEQDDGEVQVERIIPPMEHSAPNEKPSIPQNSDSIFDSTCEYIITGNELTGQIISLSTHNMHIITRPTIIKDKRYERNALMFSVGFVIRRTSDPSPFKPVLARLVKTLQRMEIESHFLSSPNTKQRIQEILDVIVPSLNSPESKCHLLLDDANVLHLQCFPPPKPHVPPVPEYVVPVLLRPEKELQNFDWDLTIKWIVLFINGINHAKLIAEEAKVDEEMVLSCLRVLRHHNVLACVDQFRYSNVYEATPKAQQTLAGEMDGLLMEAFRFVAKPPPSQASVGGSASFQCPPGNASSLGSLGNFTNSNVNGNGPSTSLRVGNSSDNHEGMPMTLLPPMDTSAPSSYPPVDSLFRRNEATQTSSSFNNNTHSGPGIYIVNNPPTPTRNGSSRSGTSPSSKGSSHPSHIMNIASVSSSNLAQPPLSMTSNQDYPKKKQRIMMTALAILYTSCERGTTVGDVWLNKIAQAQQNDEVPHTVVQDNTSTANHSRWKNGRKKRMQPKVRTRSMGSATSASVMTDLVDGIDWAEMFELLDHHRFVTFGVIHGLIRRVHEFPIAIDAKFGNCSGDGAENVEEEGTEQNEESDDNDAIGEDETLVFNNKHLNRLQSKSATYLKRHATSPNFSPSFSPKFSPALSPTLGPMPSNGPPQFSLGPNAMNTFSSSTGSLKRYPSNLSNHSTTSTITSRSTRNIRDLARKIAASMDGTRCDDELCVMYQKNMKELKSLVKTHCKKNIMSIYSISPH